MPRLKLLEMDIDNRMIYFRKDDKLIAIDADVAIELISDSLDGKYEPVRHGHWMWMGEQGDSRYMCSVCKSKEDVPTCNGEPTVWEYCPNCGAKMDESTMGQVKPSDGERKEDETC